MIRDFEVDNPAVFDFSIEGKSANKINYSHCNRLLSLMSIK